MSGWSELWLRAIARVVPADRRGEWQREWRAELAVRRDQSARAVIALLEDAMGLRFGVTAGGSSGNDLRQAARSLLRYRASSLVVVAMLALGIGATTAMVAVVRSVLLRPLPYASADELVLVGLAFRHGAGEQPIAASGPEFFELRAENRAFAGLAAFYASDVNLGRLDEPLRLPAASVTPDLLGLLGVSVALGRDFREADAAPGAADVILIGHGLWQEAFGADPAVVGRSVTVNGNPTTVVGVLPSSFEFPSGDVRLLRPLGLNPADPGGRSSHWISMVARLAPGIDVQEGMRRTDQLLARWATMFPSRHGPGEGHPVRIVGVREAATGDLRTPLLLLTIAVVLVLLVACVNVANLLLVRGEDRQRELGIRSALGAGSGTLLRQLGFEHGLLAAAGGTLGLAVAWAAARALPVLAGDVLPALTCIRLDLPLLGAAVLVTAVSALLFGLAPAVWAARSEPAGLFRQGVRGATTGPRRVAFRRGMVILEVAMAVALLASAAVLGRGFLRLLDVSPGFDPDGVVTMEFALNPAVYPDASAIASFHDELDRRLTSMPGITAAGSIRTLPLTDAGGWETLRVVGRARASDQDWTTQYQIASPGFFDALRIPVLEGRTFRPGDDAEGAPVAIVNLSAARALFGRDPALGQQVQVGNFPDNTNPVLTVVGVVGDVHQTGLDQQPPPQLYVPRAQAGAIYGGLGSERAVLAVRSDLDPRAAIASVRSVVRDIDPQLPVANVATLSSTLARSVGERRLLALLMGGFAVVALALGALGIYGLMAYVVARRTRELGIRFALGARRGRVMRTVVGEAAGLALVGSAFGVGAALAAGSLLEGLVFGVSPRDPTALVAAPGLLLAVAALAALFPAHRASRVDPATVLREE